METRCDLKMRHYEASDYPTLRGWWKYRNAERMHQNMIPPSSCIVEDANGPAAFAAVFLCNSNHVAFCHGLVTRPEMRLHDTYQVLEVLQDAIDIIMAQDNHKLLLGTVTGEGMVRGAKRMGFHVLGKPARHIARISTPPTH